MGLIKRKRIWDNNGINPATLLFLFFPSALTLGAFAYETAVEPLIDPESAPTIAGLSIEFLWVILAFITVASILLWLFLRLKAPKKYAL